MDAKTLAAELIARWEGYREFPYPDPASPLYQATRSRFGAKWGTVPARDIMAQLAPLTRTLDGKPWTVGYGCTGENIGPDTAAWSRSVALANLEGEVELRMERIRPLLNHEPKPWQMAAMTSLVYNVGLANFKKSSVLRRFNDGDLAGAADAFRMWNKAGGQVMHGLTARRDDERVMFEGFHPLLKGAK
jgi:lysozyme